MNRHQRRQMAPQIKALAQKEGLPHGFVKGLAAIVHGNKPMDQFAAELTKLAETHKLREPKEPTT